MTRNFALCSNQAQEWVDAEAPTEQDIAQIGQQYKLHPNYLQDVLQPEHLPKWEYDEESNLYFIIARYLDGQASPGAESIQQITRKMAIFTMEGRIITLHRGHVPFLEELHAKSEDPHSRYHTAFQLQCKIFKEVFRSYEPTILAASDEVEFYETKIFGNKHLPPFIKGLFQLRRRVSVLRRVLLLTRPLLDCLRDQQTTLQAPTPLVQDATDMYLRVETLLDDVHERINNLLSVHLALADQRSNEVMRVLTVFSAFFLPVTFIAGIYGMNFALLPELGWRYGYYACLALMAGVSLTIYIWFKRKGWI